MVPGIKGSHLAEGVSSTLTSNHRFALDSAGIAASRPPLQILAYIRLCVKQQSVFRPTPFFSQSSLLLSTKTAHDLKHPSGDKFLSADVFIV